MVPVHNTYCSMYIMRQQGQQCMIEAAPVPALSVSFHPLPLPLRYLSSLQTIYPGFLVFITHLLQLTSISSLGTSYIPSLTAQSGLPRHLILATRWPEKAFPFSNTSGSTCADQMPLSQDIFFLEPQGNLGSAELLGTELLRANEKVKLRNLMPNTVIYNGKVSCLHLSAPC